MCCWSHVKVCHRSVAARGTGSGEASLIKCSLQFSGTKAKPPLVADLFLQELRGFPFIACLFRHK
jgi:hypothetical protein